MLSSDRIKKEYLHKIGDERQWIVSSRNNIPIIINAFSLDQFALFQIQHKLNGNKLEDYQLRQMYNLPHTPRVILLTSSKKQHGIHLLLVQKAPYDFEKLMQSFKETREIIIAFRKILNLIEMLCKKYGYFDITQRMIKASKGGIPIIWIDENQMNNSPQIPLTNQSINNNASSQNTDMIESHIIMKLEFFFKKYHPHWNLGIRNKISFFNFSNVDNHCEQLLKGKNFSNIEINLKLNNMIGKQQYRRFTDTKMPQFLKKNSKQQHSKQGQKNSTKTTINFIGKKDYREKSIKSQKQKNSSEKITPKLELRKTAGKRCIGKWQVCGTPKSLIDPKLKQFPQYSQQSIQIQDEKRKKIQSSKNIVEEKIFMDWKYNGFPKKYQEKNIFIKDPLNNKIDINNKVPQSNKFLINISKTETQSAKQKFEVSQEPDFKTKGRDSGNSFSTAANYLSINSSGKRQGLEEDIFNNCSKNRLKLVATFGDKSSKQKLQQNEDSLIDHRLKLSGKFAVKASKIIQQKDEAVVQTPSHRSPSFTRGQGTKNSFLISSDFEHQVSNLFKSQVLDDQIIGIEQELDNILFS